jgi:hypothetical protein
MRIHRASLIAVVIIAGCSSDIREVHSDNQELILTKVEDSIAILTLAAMASASNCEIPTRIRIALDHLATEARYKLREAKTTGCNMDLVDQRTMELNQVVRVLRLPRTSNVDTDRTDTESTQPSNSPPPSPK